MPEPDPGSFRDPASRIVFDDGRVLRILDERGRSGWESLSRASFFSRAAEEGKLIGAKPVDDEIPGAAAVLEHPRLDFISYPYEWTFAMLKDAALLQLELLARALAEGLTIKDATPFNIQFVEGRPVFIDIGSFEAYSPGEPWIGYRQFTRQFLFPLMIRAWADVPFQPWLRGDMEGPTAGDTRRILPFSKRLRSSTLMHVSLQARMEERLSGAAVRSELRSAGFSAALILANVARLTRLIESLEWEGDEAGWVAYQVCDHVGRDRETKTRFLQAALDAHRPRRVVDLGANDGFYSNVAAGSGAVTVAIDGDEPVLDRLYRSGTTLNMALSDLTNPSPSQGWAGVERPGLMERAHPDLVIAYGLIHHLIYTASIPPDSVIAWLSSFRSPVVLEFVSPGDPMVSVLTANKLGAELHPGRTRDEFEALLAPRFSTAATETLGDGVRVLYRLIPR